MGKAEAGAVVVMLAQVEQAVLADAALVAVAVAQHAVHMPLAPVV